MIDEANSNFIRAGSSKDSSSMETVRSWHQNNRDSVSRRSKIITCVPKAFNRFPRSFSIWARARAKFDAAFDSVLPLVHVFSTPYFLLSSDNLVPEGKMKSEGINIFTLDRFELRKHEHFKSTTITYLDLFWSCDYITFNSTNNIPLEMLQDKKTTK